MYNEKRNRGYKAIHNLLIHGKKLTFDKLDNKKLFDYFDKLEYLMGLLLIDSDNTEQFEIVLKEICNDYDCYGVFIKYEKGIIY